MNPFSWKPSAKRSKKVAVIWSTSELVIADEPTGNLDTHSGEEIMNLLHKLHQQGTTIVMVTHDPDIAEHTQRTIHLIDGLVDNVIHNGKKVHA